MFAALGVCSVKATLTLDSDNCRFIFTAPDFFLRFAVAPTITNIEQVIENDKGYFSFICTGKEVDFYLPDILNKMRLNWDFSKYEVEVI